MYRAFPVLFLSIFFLPACKRGSSGGDNAVPAAAFNPAGQAAKLGFAKQPSTTIAGENIHVEIQVLDVFDQPVIAGNHMISVEIGPNPAGEDVLQGARQARTDNGIARFSDLQIEKAGGGYTLIASSLTLIRQTSAAFDITASAQASGLLVQGFGDSAVAGQPTAIAVTAIDPFTNTVSAYRGTVTFEITDPLASAPTSYTFQESDQGTHTFPADFVLRTAGEQNIKILDNLLGIAANVVVNVKNAPAVGYQFSTIGDPLSPSKKYSFTLRAQDAFGNQAADYLGSVNFSSTDTQASLPFPYTFVAADQGQHVFQEELIFRTPGPQSLQVFDTQNNLFSASAWNVHGPAKQFVLSISDVQEIGQPWQGDFTITAYDSFGFVVVDYDASLDPLVVWETTNQGRVFGLGSNGMNISDRAADFINGAADLSNQMIFVGPPGSYQLRITSQNTKNTITTAPISFADTKPPKVRGQARFVEALTGESIASSPKLIVPFDREILVTSADVNNLHLPVQGDLFGAGAVMSSGPRAHELQIQLGSGAQLTLGGSFASGNINTGAPSGVDVSGSLAQDAIESKFSTQDAQPSVAVDLVPWFSKSDNIFPFAIGGELFTSVALALGDVDNDGDLDVFVSLANQNNRLYLNLLADIGVLHFIDSGQIFQTVSTPSVAFADMDHDQDLDLVEGNAQGQLGKVYINDGLGNFSLATRFGNGLTNGIAIADFNGDMQLDIAEASQDNVQIWLNNGLQPLAFTQGQALDQNLDATTGLLTADFNNDAAADVLQILAFDHADVLWLNRNNGTGLFKISANTIFLTDQSQYAAAGDMNQDGSLDIVQGTADLLVDGVETASKRIWMQQTGGNQIFLPSGALGPNQTSSLALGDLDSDGDLDLVETSNAPGEFGFASNQIFFNNGAGIFSPVDAAIGGLANVVVLADIDQDGDLDILLAGAFADEPFQLYFNSSN